MSTSLMVLLPVMLLGIVATPCFVGCILDAGPFGTPFTKYTGTTILLNSNCIAYWPLKEAADRLPAAELISNNTGMYIDQNTAKPDTVYPWLEYSVANGSNPDVLNAAQVLWIGAGTPYAPRRMQPAGTDPASPLFPFVGAIQDVAIYNAVLAPTDIVTHFHNGSGTNP